MSTQSDDVLWEQLLASPEAQALLEKLADEAPAEINADQSRPLIFTEDGEIALG